MTPRSIPPSPDDIALHFPSFLGKLLEAITATHATPHHTTQPTMPPDLANLWLAASATLGIHTLHQLVLHSHTLQKLLSPYSDHPLQSDSTTQDTLALGNTLHHLSNGIALDAQQHERQQQYIYLLQCLEEDYAALLQERHAHTLPPEQHQNEIQELFTNALYSFNRLQR